MKILVTGGSGVVGRGTVTELLRGGHQVVLLSRHAVDDARQWKAGVVPHTGDVCQPASIAGAATGCDLVLHMVAIVDEEPPAVTFDLVNVQGTANIIAESERAGVPRFVFVSSLGAPTGQSAYHESKRRAEQLVRAFAGDWTICRPGNVYGPGDEQISMLLRMVRGVTALVPTIGDGTQRFQPLWWEDAARALGEVCERTDLAARELDIAGAEVTSQSDLMERFEVITGRATRRVPIPEFLAAAGAKVISMVGWNVPLSESQLQMIREENVIPEGAENALTRVLHVAPTPLDDGLRALTEQQPEQLPDEGIGSLRRKRFWADIHGDQTPEGLFAYVRDHFNDVTPVFVDALDAPGSSATIEEGASITLSLPLRGHVQVRVTGLEPTRMTLLTLQGHPLAGAVRFLCQPMGATVRFQVEVFDRAATMLDFIAMRVLGDALQSHTWTHVVESVVEHSGGSAPEGVQHDGATLDEHEAAAINAWLEEMMLQRQREENADRVAGAV